MKPVGAACTPGLPQRITAPISLCCEDLGLVAPCGRSVLCSITWHRGDVRCSVLRKQVYGPVV